MIEIETSKIEDANDQHLKKTATTKVCCKGKLCSTELIS